MKLKIFLVLVFLGGRIILKAQVSKSDSLKKELDSLKDELKRLKDLPIGCSDFEVHNTPSWAIKTIASKTYYRDCRSSGTYIILYNDSTFQYMYNGEGNANYFEMGKWKVRNDTIITLIGVPKLTNAFRKRMQQSGAQKYKTFCSFNRKYLRKQNLLLIHEYLETESN